MPNEELYECCLCTESHRAQDMQVVSVWENGVETLQQMGRDCFTKAWYDLAGLDHLQAQLRSITHQRNIFQKGYEELRLSLTQGVDHDKETV